MKKKLAIILGVGLAVLLVLVFKDDILASNSVAVLREDEEFGEISDTIEDDSEDVCRYQKPFFSSRSRKKYQVHLVFYGKPIMQALWHYCVVKDWKMSLILNATDKGVRALDRIASTPKVFTIIYTTSRSLHHPVVRQLASSPHTLVSAIRYCFKVTGPKKAQLETFRSYFQQFGCKIEDKQMMPLSYMLDDSKECLSFFKYASQNPDIWWVLKTSQGYGGDGVSIHSNLSALHSKFALCNNLDQFIVQKYLPSLMLIQGRKFDVRGLILIASTNPYMLFYHKGYLRLSLEKFSSNSDRAIHLTNSHIQTHTKQYSPDDHFWSFARLQSYLDEQDPDNGDFVTEKLAPFIKKVALFILQAGLSVFERSPSSFQLLGLDFLVTDDYNVWFIEANSYPLWPKTAPHKGKEHYIDKLMNHMAEDMFDLLFKIRESPTRFSNMAVGQSYKSMELIWSELDDKCSRKPAYNPCNEFV